jgi:hypothetical protein
MQVLQPILARRVSTIDDVIAVMTAIEEALPPGDGVRWFNHLYRRVTLGVRATIAGAGAFGDPQFLDRLDVAFANLYFDALRAGGSDPAAAPPAWRPLLAGRSAAHVLPLQFALSGMDAHINRDLPAGIVSVYEELGGSPLDCGPRRDDFERVNAILETVEAQTKADFVTGPIAAVDTLTRPVDDRVAMWSVRAAREAAWTNAAVLWQLKGVPTLQRDFFDRLDRFTGFSAQALLAAVPVHAAG